MKTITLEQVPSAVCELMERVSSLAAIIRKYEERPATENKPAYMNITEAAKYLNRAKQTIYQMIGKNLIPHYKVNGRLLFKETDLAAYVAENKVKTTNEISAEVDAELKTK